MRGLEENENVKRGENEEGEWVDEGQNEIGGKSTTKSKIKEKEKEKENSNPVKEALLDGEIGIVHKNVANASKQTNKKINNKKIDKCKE